MNDVFLMAGSCTGLNKGPGKIAPEVPRFFAEQIQS